MAFSDPIAGARHAVRLRGLLLPAFTLAALAGALAAQSQTHPVAKLFLMRSGMAAGTHAVAGQGYLGVKTKIVSDVSVSGLRLRETHGAVVVAVDHDSPAWKAGLRERDVVQSLNGTPIENEDQLSRMLRELPPGRSVQIGISRDGAAQTMSATLANRDDIGRRAWEQHYVLPAPADVAADDAAGNQEVENAGRSSRGFGHSLMPGRLLPYFPSYTGATVDEIGPQLADYFGLHGGKALLVQSVDANSPAAAAGMHAGDVVLRVNGMAMTSRGDWNRALHDSKGHTVSIVLMREHREQTITVVPGKRRGSVRIPEEETTSAAGPVWLAAAPATVQTGSGPARFVR